MLTIIFIVALQSTVASTGCPDQFENYKNKTCIYYQGYGSDEVSWTDARLACRSRGMSSLATIIDRDQESWMVYKWMDRPVVGAKPNELDICRSQQSAWIGLVRAGYRGSEWNWDDPNGTSRYRNWEAGEPSNHHSVEDCTILILFVAPRGTKTFSWYDTACEPRSGFWCNRASGFFCSTPYVAYVPTVAPDSVLRVAQGKEALNDARSKAEVANNALWITVLVLLAIVLPLVGFIIWKYNDLIKRKMNIFDGSKKTITKEHLGGE